MTISALFSQVRNCLPVGDGYDKACYFYSSCSYADSIRFDLIWTIPHPYNEITDVYSEECPGLDVRPRLVAQL